VTEVTLMDGETFDSLLRRFNRKVQHDGVLSEIKRREHYEPPSMVRKKKAAAKKRKSFRSRGPS
jgi:small subunit ribosomal protein S21